jgi:hypothetical protein
MIAIASVPARHFGDDLNLRRGPSAVTQIDAEGLDYAGPRLLSSVVCAKTAPAGPSQP